LVSFDGARDGISSEIFDLNLSRELMRRNLSAGEIGCAYGHLLAYQRCEESDWLIVLEDDVEIINTTLELEEFLCKGNFSKDAAVVFFDLDSEKLKLWNFKKFPWYHRPYGTHAYAINRKALELVQASHQQILSTADWPIQWAYSIDFFSARVNVFSLLNIGSTIEEGRKPLQAIAEKDFQDFRSLDFINQILNRFSIGKYFLGMRYFLRRFRVYYKHRKLFSKRKYISVLALAYADLN
jgi:GR25 family glycosyltransferase involved in LPS biosynthesis